MNDGSGLCRGDTGLARYAGSRSADFHARFAPNADPDRLWLAALWVSWVSPSTTPATTGNVRLVVWFDD
ncbi:hypothetical protein ACFFKE_31875 [Streptomyces mutabilis]|uniref:hypothetical protein n=1 Tax=Streptomyces mutabilis TaxID=67332 RepID=UPI00177C31E4|nr:hypothetical protein [Streptomyces mutabilis]GGQ19591.1 hypothetical protein GCM10010279_29240 [Streptomyces mutabilis]